MKSTVIVALILTVLFLLHNDKIVFAQTPSASVNTSYTILPPTVNRTLMLKLVNEARKKGCQCGDTYFYPAPPVVWNSLLEEAAYKHASDMSKNKFFSHYAPDGSRGGDRLKRVGYTWKIYGENIGEGYKTEKEMLEGWLASPGHCKNIMNKGFNEMGVARVGTLWTQEFGSRK